MREGRKSQTGDGGLANRRSITGKLVKPRQQLKFSFLLFSGTLLMLIVFAAVVAFALNQAMVSLEVAHALQPELATALRQSISLALTLILLLAGLFSIASIFIGIYFSHRVFGPLIPLQRHIEELRSGNYSSRVHLRKSDELVELERSLNGLAESLEAKYGSQV